MRRRRILFGALVIASMIGMLELMATALRFDQLSVGGIIMLILFSITLPWMTTGFWNASIGFLIWRFVKDPIAAVIPIASGIDPHAPITCSTAILLCIRNESPERLIRNLTATMQGLATPGIAEHMHVYVLSDTNDAQHAHHEQACFDELAQAWEGRLALTYRRRTDNAGYKAGNIADFCTRWGANHDVAITLDADSFMTGAAILRLVRIMQANPTLGILQGLVVGMPTTSGFTRLFQFGMRLGMRSYTIGTAWWQGDCGPYWGHNAAIRLAPFITDCELPTFTDRHGHSHYILSHDQIEAVLMRRAGFDVRVLPAEDESWEENPPTLIEYIRRDLRWCEGNMQYVHLLAMPGLKPVSRFQLVNAVFMFLGSPAWICLLTLGSIMLAFSPTPSAFMHHDSGMALFILALLMWYLPKIAGAIDVLLRADQRQSFGGALRFSLGFTLEMILSVLMTPITWLNHTIFLAGLLFGKKTGWGGQTRDDHSVPLDAAIRQFWPHTLLGFALLCLLGIRHPELLPYAVVLFGGLALAIPLAVLTSWPIFGRILRRYGLANLPEETHPPAPLQALGLAAYQSTSKTE
jgi:membrane glycosyltransferase